MQVEADQATPSETETSTAGETKVAEAKADEAKAAQVTVAQAKAAEAKGAVAKEAEAKAERAKAAEAAAAEAKAAGARTSKAKADQTKAPDANSTEAKAVERPRDERPQPLPTLPPVNTSRQADGIRKSNELPVPWRSRATFFEVSPAAPPPAPTPERKQPSGTASTAVSHPLPSLDASVGADDGDSAIGSADPPGPKIIGSIPEKAAAQFARHTQPQPLLSRLEPVQVRSSRAASSAAAEANADVENDFTELHAMHMGLVDALEAHGIAAEVQGMGGWHLHVTSKPAVMALVNAADNGSGAAGTGEGSAGAQPDIKAAAIAVHRQAEQAQAALVRAMADVQATTQAAGDLAGQAAKLRSSPP